ncbi:unnamed protein product [Caenorhabditis bovis]|uniref:Tr-type G domain-containing protein n=1 Tax=Caenorhabditis bovis TaxID=2654633 RepID=A0A8S1F0G7_9PELO|nr:unnamed protein product [Caenorhabditis bovis]
MSRHRNVRNMNLADEYYDDYDDDDYYDDDEEPTNSEFTYDRTSSSSYFNLLSPKDKNSSASPNNSEVKSVPKITAPPATQITKPPNPIQPSSQPSQKVPNVQKLIKDEKSLTPKQMQKNHSDIDLTTLRKTNLANIARASSAPRKPKKRSESKHLINMIVVGHVDAGKSTLMGHLLFDMGFVDNRTMDKYKHESSRTGKSSFAYAWVLDETQEERERGVTMDVGRICFETNSKRIVLLDAPGHKDFISNMITGTSQADAAILVVNGTRGEFETGFENGGQTKEHAMLLRSLGVTQLIVAVNKLDTVDWSKERFDEIKEILNQFLTKQAGFASTKLKYVPVSGLSGENLTKRFSPESMCSWYHGPCLLELIDSFVPPKQLSDGPLRIVVSDVLKVTNNQLVFSGKVESGEIEKDDKVYIMPNGTSCAVKACSTYEGAHEHCIAGDYILATLSGSFEPDSIHSGAVVVRGGPDTLLPAHKFVVRLVVFDVTMPIMKGTKTELYAHSLCVPCSFTKLVSIVNKTTGEVTKNRPRYLTKGTSAVVEIETEYEVAIESFTSCRALGRVTFRSSGQTIAAGIVESQLR